MLHCCLPSAIAVLLHSADWRVNMRSQFRKTGPVKSMSKHSDQGKKARKVGFRKNGAPPLPRITPVDGVSIERQVYQALRFALMCGSIQPGAGLTSRSLSQIMGVSPTPVREALKRLDADGALFSKSKSGFFVSDPDKFDFAEILEIRLNLEGYAIRRAAINVTNGELDNLKAINARFRKVMEIEGENAAEELRLNFLFHFEIYKLSRSPVLIQMIETLWLRIGPTLHRYMPPRGDDTVSNFHAEMLKALERHDPVAAELALRNDLVAASHAIAAQLPDRTD